MADLRSLVLAGLLPALFPAPAPARQAPPVEVQARPSDAQIEALAKSAMASTDPKFQAEALRRLQEHHFKSSLARERELALFVQGMLEDRLGQGARAAVTFHKLELAWPQSSYLAEGQVVMAEAAVARRRFQEAESRLRRALTADIPADSQRRGQELLLWCLAEQGRSHDAAPILQALKPLGSEKPSERGLVGLMEAHCAAGHKEQAAEAQRSYRQFFPNGPHAQRVDLDWAKLLGTLGEAQGAAEAFRALIQASPAAPEADEARLALATLLTDGRLPAKEAGAFPPAQSLLAGMRKGALKDAPARQALLVKLRLAAGERRWRDVLVAAGQYRILPPPHPEAPQVDEIRMGAVRNWAQELLDQGQYESILPYLDREGITSLTPAQRLALVGRLAQAGLPEAARDILPLAPPGEWPALTKAALSGTASAANPRAALALLPGKGEDPQESLVRAQAELALKHWPEARAALAKARPGPERIQTLLAFLRRPADAGVTPQDRRKEVDAWLARAPEQGANREPLAILAGDLRVQEGDWRGALARYPSAPQPGNRGWVALMRATCQERLGQKDAARETLREAKDDKAYQADREALEQRLAL